MAEITITVEYQSDKAATTVNVPLTINAKFEVKTGNDGIAGMTEAPVKRIEQEDDGSLTVVIDHWPAPVSLNADNTRMRALLALFPNNIGAGLLAKVEGVGIPGLAYALARVRDWRIEEMAADWWTNFFASTARKWRECGLPGMPTVALNEEQMRSFFESLPTGHQWKLIQPQGAKVYAGVRILWEDERLLDQ